MIAIFRNSFYKGVLYMNRINKDGKRVKLNIQYIYNPDGAKLKEILKEGYLCYLRNLKTK